MTYGTLRTTPAKLMLNQNRNLAPRENLEVHLNPEIRDLEVLQVQVHLPLGLGAEVEEAGIKDLAQGPRGPEKGKGGEDILVPHAVALGQGIVGEKKVHQYSQNPINCMIFVSTSNIIICRR